MKRVYFVRHGESTSNVVKCVQALSDPLTPHGEEQALQIGGRAAQIEFEALISSDAVRAHETAKAIAHVTGKEIELSPLFREGKRPTSLEGALWTTPERDEYMKIEMEHWGEPGWRFADEESYEDLLARTRAALVFLETHKKENLLVVTHGRFMGFLLAYMTVGEAVTPAIALGFEKTFRMSNTGLTICVRPEDKWYVKTWNDFAHLAD